MVDGLPRSRLDPAELVAAVAREPVAVRLSGRLDSSRLRRWARAELRRVVAQDEGSEGDGL